MRSEDLVQRLKDDEDGFTERKPDGVNRSDLRRTIVAFANSVPEERSAILFIGVANDGTVNGVSNPDSLQKTIREVAEQDCYPSVKLQTEVISITNKKVVAVIVEASIDRPHFSGPAFVRIGSESKIASQEMYEELIASRNTKAGKILRNKDKLITLDYWYIDLPSKKKIRDMPDCTIKGCDGHVVHLHNDFSGKSMSFPLEDIKISYDQAKNRMMIQVNEQALQ